MNSDQHQQIAVGELPWEIRDVIEVDVGMGADAVAFLMKNDQR